MRRQLLMRTAVGSLLALAACADRDTTTVSNDPNERITLTEQSAPNAGPGNGKALLFPVPREASVLLLARP